MPRPSIPIAHERWEAREQQNEGGVLQSSLDIVFSYSRSQTFFGSNLPSSPSFVHRHPYLHSSSPPSAPEPHSSTAESDEEDVFSDWSEEGEGEPAELLGGEWDDESPGRGRLRVEFEPERGRSRSRSSRPMSRGTSPPTSRPPSMLLSPSPKKVVDEHTPLLVPSPPPERPQALPRRRSSARSGRTIVRVRGRSTFGQTLFNTVGVLVGVGILSLPLAFSLAGWIGGLSLFIFMGLVTNYTAKILASIVTSDPALYTYADVGVRAFGPKARAITSFIFCVELFLLSVALLILFGDSLAGFLGPSHALPPALLKVIGFLIILPTLPLPLHYLSITSLLGGLSTIALLLVVILCGALNRHAPGSLWEPAPTRLTGYAGVWGWGGAVGLIMAGFSGHAVVPSLARDMREPEKFGRMIDLAYIITCVIYLGMAICGYLMFGSQAAPEITQNLTAIHPSPYPHALLTIASIALIMNPLTKFALSTRPLSTTAEILLGLQPFPADSAPTKDCNGAGGGVAQVAAWGRRESRKRCARVGVRVLLAAASLAVAVLVPAFDKVMGFLGAFAAFTIAVIAPLLFHMAIRRRVRVIDAVLVLVSTALAIWGTVWAFLPKRAPEG